MASDPVRLDSLALTPAPGDETTAECPFCGAKKGHFYVNPTKGVYYCHKCGASGRLTAPPRIPPRPRQEPQAELAPPDRIDTAYRALLQTLELSQEHLEHLLTVRGMSKAQVEENGYRTLPPDQRLRIAGEVASICDPSGVPGFYCTAGEWGIAGWPGLLIPAKDFDGKVLGCQIRTFDERLPKYLWLSSAGKKGGTQAVTRFHAVHGSKSQTTMWLTEGPLKADIAAPRLGATVVAIPGVNTVRPSLVKEMKKRGCRIAVLAFDSDARQNPLVATALRKALALLEDEGLEVKVATWEGHKGLDDLLLAGGSPQLVKHRRAQNVNQLYLSGRIKTVTPKGIPSANSGDPRKKLILVIDDPKGMPIPAIAFGEVAEALEAQNPEPGDWIEAKGCVRAWKGYYGDPLTNVVIGSAEVLKKLQPAWWEQPEVGAAASTEAQK